MGASGQSRFAPFQFHPSSSPKNRKDIMGYRYTNEVEGGQVIESDDIIEHLEGQALWQREVIGDADASLAPRVHDDSESVPFTEVSAPVFATEAPTAPATDAEIIAGPFAIVTNPDGTVTGDGETLATLTPSETAEAAEIVEPAADADREDWAAYALRPRDGAPVEADIAALSRDELRDRFGTPAEPPAVG